ncbi:MAG TPA: hypothetical protein VMH22_12580 [bacterium]|nr:hypothetical protein [bacterium]
MQKIRPALLPEGVEPHAMSDNPERREVNHAPSRVIYPSRAMPHSSPASTGASP